MINHYEGSKYNYSYLAPPKQWLTNLTLNFKEGVKRSWNVIPLCPKRQHVWSWIEIGDPEYLHLYFKLWNGWLGAIIWWETGIFFTFVENDLNQWKGSAIIDYNNNMYVKLVLKYLKIYS